MSQLASIENLKDLSDYKKDLKKSLDNVQASPAKMFYASAFEFKGRKGPLLLVGELPSGLSKGLKEARVSLRPGKCRRNERKELEVFRGLPPDKIALALKFAGIDDQIAEKEVVGEPGENASVDQADQGIEVQEPALSPAMQKKMAFETAEFGKREKGKYDEREKSILAELQNLSSTRKDDPAFGALVKDIKSEILQARTAVAGNGFDAANQILDHIEGTLRTPAKDNRMEKKLAFETGEFEKRADAQYQTREKQILASAQQFAAEHKDDPEALRGIKDLKGQILAARGSAARRDYEGANAILDQLDVATRKKPAQTGKQEELRGKLTSEFEYLKGASVRFQQGRGKELRKLTGGKEFKDFVSKLEKFESTMNGPDRDALEKSALVYLAHYEKDLSAQKQQDSARKKLQVEQTLRNIKLLKLSDEAAGLSLGVPPWPKDKEEKAKELHAKILVTDGRVGKLKDTEKGNSDSFFLNDTNGKPAYIFKPQKGESRPMLKDHGTPTDTPDPNWPEGGGAPREKVFSDFNEDMKANGLDFGIAGAVVVELESDEFARGKMSQERKRVGVAQEAITNNGNAKNFILDGPASDLGTEIASGTVTPEIIEARKKSIKTEDVQKIALLDFITLNGDRNADNILLQGKSDKPGETRLRPIDAGNALPSRKAFEANCGSMHAVPSQKGKGISEGNALMQLPQSLEPFSPEMLKQIDSMDPARVAGSLQRSNASLQGEMGGKIEDETFQMVERSVQFLKLACKVSPPPTVNEIGDIYATEFTRVLDAKKEDLPRLVIELVKTAKERSARMLADLKAAELENDNLEKEYKQLGGLAELKRLGGDDQGSLKGNVPGLRRLKTVEQEYLTLGGDAEYKRLGGQIVVGKGKTISHLRDDLKRLKGAEKK